VKVPATNQAAMTFDRNHLIVRRAEFAEEQFTGRLVNVYAVAQKQQNFDAH